MTPEDLKKAPKLFAENVRIGFTPEYFVMGISSGNQSQIYSFSPAHIKRLQQYIEHELKEYESKHGVVTAKWDPNVVSPVQRANPPTNGS